MEISEEEYMELCIYKRIVTEAIVDHIAAKYIAEKTKESLEKKLEKIKP